MTSFFDSNGIPWTSFGRLPGNHDYRVIGVMHLLFGQPTVTAEDDVSFVPNLDEWSGLLAHLEAVWVDQNQVTYYDLDRRGT